MDTLIMSLLAGCTTQYRADPATFSHLSCEKLRGLYDPNSKLLVPEFEGDDEDNIASTNLGGIDANDYRDEETKFRTDVRAAYKAKGCSSATSKISSILDIDESELAARLAQAGISIETLKKPIRSEIAYQRRLGNVPTTIRVH